MPKKIDFKIHTGDILFFSERGIIPSLIRFFTKSKYSHVGVVVKILPEHDAVLVAEALLDGFVINKREMSEIRQNVRVGRVFAELSRTRRNLFRSEVIKLMGTKYDFKALFVILKRLFIRGRRITSYNDLMRIICTEAIHILYEKMGAKLSTINPAVLTPKDLSRSKLIRFLN